jgi:hypothetical protein
MTSLLDKLVEYIAIEKASKVGYHGPHDGWPEHPSAVKHHQEYFAKKPTGYPPSYKELYNTLGALPPNTPVVINNATWVKANDGKWRLYPGDPGVTIPVMLYTLKEKQLKTILDNLQKKPPQKDIDDLALLELQLFGDILPDGEISLANSKEQDHKKIVAMLDFMPIGTQYQIDGLVYSKTSSGTWQLEPEGWPERPDGDVASSIKFNTPENQWLRLPKKQGPSRFGDVDPETNEVSLVGAAGEDKDDILTMLAALPVGAQYHMPEEVYEKIGTSEGQLWSDEWASEGTRSKEKEFFYSDDIAFAISHGKESEHKLTLPQKEKQGPSSFGDVDPETNKISLEGVEEKDISDVDGFLNKLPTGAEYIEGKLTYVKLPNGQWKATEDKEWLGYNVNSTDIVHAVKWSEEDKHLFMPKASSPEGWVPPKPQEISKPVFSDPIAALVDEVPNKVIATIEGMPFGTKLASSTIEHALLNAYYVKLSDSLWALVETGDNYPDGEIIETVPEANIINYAKWGQLKEYEHPVRIEDTSMPQTLDDLINSDVKDFLDNAPVGTKLMPNAGWVGAVKTATGWKQISDSGEIYPESDKVEDDVVNDFKATVLEENITGGSGSIYFSHIEYPGEKPSDTDAGLFKPLATSELQLPESIDDLSSANIQQFIENAPVGTEIVPNSGSVGYKKTSEDQWEVMQEDGDLSDNNDVKNLVDDFDAEPAYYFSHIEYPKDTQITQAGKIQIPETTEQWGHQDLNTHLGATLAKTPIGTTLLLPKILHNKLGQSIEKISDDEWKSSPVWLGDPPQTFIGEEILNDFLDASDESQLNYVGAAEQAIVQHAATEGQILDKLKNYINTLVSKDATTPLYKYITGAISYEAALTGLQDAGYPGGSAANVISSTQNYKEKIEGQGDTSTKLSADQIIALSKPENAKLFIAHLDSLPVGTKMKSHGNQVTKKTDGTWRDLDGIDVPVFDMATYFNSSSKVVMLGTIALGGITSSTPKLAIPSMANFKTELDFLPIGSSFEFKEDVFTFVAPNHWASKHSGNIFGGREEVYSFLLANEETSGASPGTFFKQFSSSFKVPKINWNEKLEKIGEQLGSQPGAKYQDKATGQQYYVKSPGSERAAMEHLAGQLYKLAGVSTPETELIDFGGDTAVKSTWLDDAKSMTAAEMKGQPEVIKNFAIDAWLANWDVIGANDDNIVSVRFSKDAPPKIFRVDSGGTLMYRAQGGAKEFGPEVKELQTMIDPNINPKGFAVFGNMPEDARRAIFLEGAKKLAKITDEQINDLVNASPLSAEQRINLNQTLRARRDYITAEFEIGKKGRKKKECQPGYHRHDKYQNCHPETQKHREDKIAVPVDVNKVLTKNKNAKMRDLFQEAKDLKMYSNLYGFADEHGISKEHSEMRDAAASWGSGGGASPVTLRAAIAEIQGVADAIRAAEGGYFMYEQSVPPDTFDQKYKRGRNNAVGLVAMVALTQKSLRERYPSGKVTVYRGMVGRIADQLKKAIKSASEDAPIYIPHDGISGYSLKRDVPAHSFGVGGIILTKEVPIEAIWLDLALSEISGSHSHEAEILVDSAYVTKFRRDQISSN